jgi:hypothetical protein
LKIEALVRLTPVQPASRYRYHMLQASLRTPVQPVNSYSPASLNRKQEEWMAEIRQSPEKLEQIRQASTNPYDATALPRQFFRQAVSSGLFFNQAF